MGTLQAWNGAGQMRKAQFRTKSGAAGAPDTGREIGATDGFGSSGKAQSKMDGASNES